MEVIGTKGSIALGAFPLTGVVARLDAVEAEDVEAFGEHGVLLARVAAGTGELSLRMCTDQRVRGWGISESFP